MSSLPDTGARLRARTRVAALCVLFKLRIRKRQEASQFERFEADYANAVAEGHIVEKGAFRIGWEASDSSRQRLLRKRARE